MTKSWQNHKEISSPFAIQAIRWIAQNIGRSGARLLLFPITLYYLIFAREQRKASLHYLTRALGKKPTLLDLAKHIHCFASTILDRVYLMTGQFDKLEIKFPSENMPLKYSRQGVGCILLGSHVGSFEVLRSYAVRKCPLPIKILMYEGQNPMIVKALNALNPDLADMVIPIGAPDSLLQVRDAVDAGQAVGMLGDRVMDVENEKTVACTLLGGKVIVPAAPILIAASLKVPVIVFFGIYKGGKNYELHFELLAERIELNRQHRFAQVQSWMQKYMDILESHIKQSPYNWFNFYDYWQDGESFESERSASLKEKKIGRPEIERLIPHSGKMSLIDEVIDWDSKTIHCSTNSHRNIDNPLRLKGEFSTVLLLEYGAQSMAIHGGLIKKSATPGFLASVRNVRFYKDNLDEIVGNLIIKAEALIKNDTGVIYEFSIFDTNQNLLLEARATVINN